MMLGYNLDFLIIDFCKRVVWSVIIMENDLVYSMGWLSGFVMGYNLINVGFCIYVEDELIIDEGIEDGILV